MIQKQAWPAPRYRRDSELVGPGLQITQNRACKCALVEHNPLRVGQTYKEVISDIYCEFRGSALVVGPTTSKEGSIA